MCSFLLRSPYLPHIPPHHPTNRCVPAAKATSISFKSSRNSRCSVLARDLSEIRNRKLYSKNIACTQRSLSTVVDSSAVSAATSRPLLLPYTYTHPIASPPRSLTLPARIFSTAQQSLFYWCKDGNYNISCTNVCNSTEQPDAILRRKWTTIAYQLDLTRLVKDWRSTTAIQSEPCEAIKTAEIAVICPRSAETHRALPYHVSNDTAEEHQRFAGQSRGAWRDGKAAVRSGCLFGTNTSRRGGTRRCYWTAKARSLETRRGLY